MEDEKQAWMPKLVLSQEVIKDAFRIQGIELEIQSSLADGFSMHSWGQEINYIVNVVCDCSVLEVYRKTNNTILGSKLIFRCKLTLAKLVIRGNIPEEIQEAMEYIFARVNQAWDIVNCQASDKQGSYLCDSFYRQIGSNDRFFPTGKMLQITKFNPHRNREESVRYPIYTNQKVVTFVGALDGEKDVLVEKIVALDY